MKSWRERLRDILIRPEPPVPDAILGVAAERFRLLPDGANICVKLSTAYDLAYPFRVSPEFVGKVVSEIRAINPTLRILLTEGGVGASAIQTIVEKSGLDAVPGARFIDAEAGGTVYVANPSASPYQSEGFWLPKPWAEADMRVLLTTCKLRTHHFQRWYSGGTRNLIGLLPRSQYRLSASRRNMRSALHQQGMDAMVADLYATTGRNVLTILDARLLARQDEHLPLRFTRSAGQVCVESDPYLADNAMVDLLGLPFTPPYLAMIEEAGWGRQAGMEDPLTTVGTISAGAGPALESE